MTMLRKVVRREFGKSKYLLLIALLLISITLAVAIGPVQIQPLTVWQIIYSKMFNTSVGNWSKSELFIVWYIRFPRVILALFIGAGLSVVGLVIQAIVLNPLGSPFTLGVSSGASLGAVTVIGLGTFYGLSSRFIPVGAFLGALLALMVVYWMANRKGQFHSGRLILSGVAISYFFSAMSSFLTIIADDRASKQIVFWLLGGLSGTKWRDIALASGTIIVGSIYLLFQYRSLNLLFMGEETAMTLGLNVSVFRKKMFVVTSLITGVIVAVSGVIGFVGLVMPHVCRMILGSNHKDVIPLSLLFGAIYLIWIDVLARIVIAPSEMPIGIITSMCGVPFFLWLIHNKKSI